MFLFPTPAFSAFSDARAWSLGYGDKPRIPLVADVDGSGNSAIVSINPSGDGSVDVQFSPTGLKPSGGITALNGFKGCQDGTAGIVPGDREASIFGIFGGDRIGVASSYNAGHLVGNDNWAKLPHVLNSPHLALIDGRRTLLAFSESGDGFKVDTATKAVTPTKIPGNLVWVGDDGENLVGQKKDGSIFWLDAQSLKLKNLIAKESINSRPAAASGIVVYQGHLWTKSGNTDLSQEYWPREDVVFGLGSGSSGRPALYEFRQGNEFHKGGLILRRLGAVADEQSSTSDPTSVSYQKDSSNDGLLDGWKESGFRGLDLKALGCSIGHADVLCLVSRFDDVDKAFVESDMKRIVKFYADLPVKNPDGSTGIRFHPIYLDPVAGPDKNNPWWVNRDKFLPSKWKGVVHWMQITRGGGGQADELSDGGTCGQGALWAVFVHEFGHQLGLNHEGFSEVGASPIYTSLMNYTWSYSFEETRDKIHYSDGRFAKLQLHENDLDETLPFPYDQVKFLSMAPYHFRMQPAGDKTLIDWNWDGVFGEKHVKASINYAYSTTAGIRDNVTKTKTAPWIFVHQKHAMVLYGTNKLPVDLNVQPTITADRPGSLMLKRMQEPTKWDKEWTIEANDLVGDPVAESLGKSIVCAFPTAAGLKVQFLSIGDGGPKLESSQVLTPDRTLVPTMGFLNRQLYLFDWNPTSHEVGYRLVSDGQVGSRKVLDVPSSNPVGLCTDRYSGQAIIGLAQDQPKGKTNRWQIRRYWSGKDGTLTAEGGPDWIEGEDGGARGTGRLIVLFDSSRDAGPHGRVLLYGKGITDDKSPWACSYVAQQIADKTYHGGWIVKRYYDEWSQTRSAPAAAWFGPDILFAYRWTAGDQSETDNNLHLGYHGLGIEPGIMTDFDDNSYVRNFGLANSILNLNSN